MTRLERLLPRLSELGVDAFLVSGVENIRYLSGYTGHAAHALVTPHGASLITDYRYAEVAQEDCTDFEVVIRDRATTTLPAQIAQLLDRSQAKRVAFESEFTTVAQLEGLRAGLPQRGLEPCAGVVEALRYVKDATEIACLRRAAALADEALAGLLRDVVRVGVSEREIALDLEYRLQRSGSEGLSFETILLSGPRSSLPHGAPGERRLAAGDFVLFDFGAKISGYGSDMTRTVVVGEPDERQRAVYDTVLRAQQAALDVIAPGVTGAVPYIAAREVIDASPFAEFAGEGLGHGVGLFLHEQPLMMGADCEQVLRPGCVVTVEPGIYIPGWGGVRIEDDVEITETGYERITHSPRELICL
ncbi:MAG: aminopeptidase P family protein [Myxococcales bacterium FL481]|nr:MAG: aminopeptidase P family protein [Myxococcales bacterium FL481]